jgi:anti-anti-sigma regulatory factor
MLRITRRPDQALRLEGRLTREEVALLRGAAAGCGAVDLSGLAFVDESGADALRELARQGCELRGGSPFVRQLLGEMAS